jgi:hypothetical protein
MSSAAPEAPRAALESVENPERASALLSPLRLRLVRMAQEPASATELARRLRLPRQRVNYHVRELARAGFLRPAGRRRKRNWVEQRYVATARSYVLSPAILGGLAPDWRGIEDTASAEYLLALTEQVRLDLSRAAEEARGRGQRVSTLSLKFQFRFDSPEQREAFANALRQSVIEVIARHTAPDRPTSGTSRAGRGRPHRLVLGCYPVPQNQEAPGEAPGPEGE